MYPLWTRFLATPEALRHISSNHITNLPGHHQDRNSWQRSRDGGPHDEMVSIEIVTSRHHGILVWGFMGGLSHLKPGDFFSGDGQSQKCKKIALKGVEKWAMEKIPGFSRFTSTEKWRISKYYVLLTRILAILLGFPNPKSPFKFRGAAGNMRFLHWFSVWSFCGWESMATGDRRLVTVTASKLIRKWPNQGPFPRSKNKAKRVEIMSWRPWRLFLLEIWSPEKTKISGPTSFLGNEHRGSLLGNLSFILDCSGGPRVAFCQDKTSNPLFSYSNQLILLCFWGGPRSRDISFFTSEFCSSWRYIFPFQSCKQGSNSQWSGPECPPFCHMKLLIATSASTNVHSNHSWHKMCWSHWSHWSHWGFKGSRIKHETPPAW